ncbi:MAG TPA: hypothetical protein VLI93_17605, partial [Acetobacteraceae bacterium]|nr:hypothetical protein [Acetobacteraceae bacterium]
ISIHGSHQGLRSQTTAPTGRTHDRKWPFMQSREKTLASRGPSTHDGGNGRHDGGAVAGHDYEECFAVVA